MEMNRFNPGMGGTPSIQVNNYFGSQGGATPATQINNYYSGMPQRVLGNQMGGGMTGGMVGNTNFGNSMGGVYGGTMGGVMGGVTGNFMNSQQLQYQPSMSQMYGGQTMGNMYGGYGQSMGMGSGQYGQMPMYGMGNMYGSGYGAGASMIQNNYGTTYNFFGSMGINPQQYMGYGQSSGYSQPYSNYGYSQPYSNYGYSQPTSTSSSSTPPSRPPDMTPQSGTLSKKDDGSINYATTGGWKVNVNGTTITMTSPDGKDTTKIWGDPHVVEADGSKWDWDAKTSTFLLPDGTKVTMNADSASGVVKSTSIYDKAQQVTIDNSKMTFTSSVDKKKTKEAEQKEDDGQAYQTKNQGNDWDKWTKDGAKKTSSTGNTTINNYY